MALTLNLTAHEPADIAALVNEALDHDRAEHRVEIDDDGDITISIEIRAARRNQRPIQPGRAQVPPACEHPADLADPVHCYLLEGHDGAHRYHGLTWDDDGTVLPADHPAPQDDDPLLDEYDGHTVDVGNVAEAQPEPTPEPDLGAAAKALGEDPGGSGGASPPLTCGEAIIQLLESDRDVAWSIADIADGITGSWKQSTVSFTLGELARDGAIRRAGRGLYQATPA